jgi:hypothetical protein
MLTKIPMQRKRRGAKINMNRRKRFGGKGFAAKEITNDASRIAHP